MLSDLQAAENRIPSCGLCYFVRSKVHQSAGDIPAAIADLKSLVTHVTPDFDQVWYRLGVLYRKQGRKAEAEDAFHHYRASRSASVNPVLQLVRSSLLDQEKR